MSSTKDSLALDLSSVSIEEEEEDDVEVSLDLSIGRGVRKSSKFQNSMESVENSSSELTIVAVTTNKDDADLPALRCSVVGDLDGDPTKSSEVQAQRKREAKRKREERLDEPQMFQCRVSHETEIGTAEPHLAGNSSEMESIERKSFKDGETTSRNSETGNLRPVVLQSSRNLGERVTGTACSAKESEETVGISPAGKTNSMPSISQAAAGGSKTENRIDPIPHKPTSAGQTSLLDTKPGKEPNSNSSGRKAFKPNPNPNPQIPCVSTTGNGPNGRTVTGFLYKYTNVEVSIVCACHGSTFTPAEFVEHAGGMNISNPLRHIMVIPSFM